MRVTVSVPDADAYDADVPLPDRPRVSKDIEGVIHRTVHGYGSGTAALAKRMNIPLGTLQQKANVNNPQHFFHPAQLLELIRATGDVAILNFIAQFVDCRVVSDKRQHDVDLLEALCDFQVTCADLMVQATRLQRDIAHGVKKHASSNDINRVLFHTQEVQNALLGVERAAQALRRVAPEVNP